MVPARQRLDDLNDAYRLFPCRTIMNCSEVCPKGLERSHATEENRMKMAGLPLPPGGLDVHSPKPPRWQIGIGCRYVFGG
jgi:succinate dehydrogenase / fumarate reductase iron-sulfur subunit